MQIIIGLFIFKQFNVPAKRHISGLTASGRWISGIASKRFRCDKSQAGWHAQMLHWLSINLWTAGAYCV